jgi:hypothetical protein
MPEEVECHSGSAYGERPIAFHWQGHRIAVEKILARWRSPHGPAFRLLGSDGESYELHYAEANQEWEIHLA